MRWGFILTTLFALSSQATPMTAYGVCEIQIYRGARLVDYIAVPTGYYTYRQCTDLEGTMCYGVKLPAEILAFVERNAFSLWNQYPPAGSEIEWFERLFYTKARWECFNMRVEDEVPDPLPVLTKEWQERRAPRQNPTPGGGRPGWDPQDPDYDDKTWPYWMKDPAHILEDLKQLILDVNAMIARKVIPILLLISLGALLVVGAAATTATGPVGMLATLAAILLIVWPYMDQAQKNKYQKYYQASVIDPLEDGGSHFKDIGVRIEYPTPGTWKIHLPEGTCYSGKIDDDHKLTLTQPGC